MSSNNTDTIDPIPNPDPKDGKDNKAVKTALKLIKQNYNYKSERDHKNEIVKDFIEEGFDLNEATGPRKINSKKLQQVYWKTASRMKPLDFVVHAAQRPEIVEKLVTDGVSTVLRKGGYIQALRDKGGAFQNMLAYGDAFVMFGTNEESKGFPMKFTPIANNNGYPDKRSTAMRSGSKPAQKFAVITSHTWAEFIALYPNMKNKAGVGRIPRDYYLGKDLDQKFLQQDSSTDEDDLVEVCFYYDLANMHYIVFAGGACTVIEEKKGDNYPFVFENKDTKVEEPYIPILHFMCNESFEGFYNHGLFEMIYDLALSYQRLFNMAESHAEENTYPYTMLSLAQGQGTKVINQLEMAGEARAQGKIPMIVHEESLTDPRPASMTSLVTQNLMQETQLMWDMLDREIKRLGIFLDELEDPINELHILSDIQNANMFVRNMQEKNASEYEFMAKVVIDQIAKTVSKNDKTPVQMTTTINVDGQTIRGDGLTLGMLSEELKEHDYFVKVNALSGADMSRLKKAQVTNMLSLAPPGSAAHGKLVGQLAQLNDVDIPGEEFGMPQQPQSPQAVPTESAPPAQPTEGNMPELIPAI